MYSQLRKVTWWRGSSEPQDVRHTISMAGSTQNRPLVVSCWGTAGARRLLLLQVLLIAVAGLAVSQFPVCLLGVQEVNLLVYDNQCRLYDLTVSGINQKIFLYLVHLHFIHLAHAFIQNVLRLRRQG